ncbi:hypothetical protein HY988_04450 [Candidatus Micrarchaeota archaeon]|nr:hypothetical protein [Candidatus Micrarchaeota archaeon]
MLSIRIRAQRYLDKHRPSLADFGAGVFIDQGKLTIAGDMQAAQEGLFLIKTSGGRFNDCTKVAHDIWADIFEHEPELRPIIAAYQQTAHFWVEVNDEKRRVIQIDGTPWYGRLDPGHKKMRTVDPASLNPSTTFYAIEERLGLVLSVRAVKNKFLTTTLRGSWPRAILFGEQLERNLEAGYGLPDMRIILLFRKALGPTSPIQQTTIVPVCFELINSGFIGDLELNNLDAFILADFIRLGISDFREVTHFSSLSEIEVIVREHLGDIGIEELRLNLGRVLKLLKDSMVQG